MIMLNWFIGIIMNSMSEMHRESEERERAQHVKEYGCTTLADELNLLKQQIVALNKQTARLRVPLGDESSRNDLPGQWG